MSGAKIIEGMQEAVAFARGEETGAVLHDVGSLEWWRKRAQWLSERVDTLSAENRLLHKALAAAEIENTALKAERQGMAQPPVRSSGTSV
jgi:hypothetical protein